MTSLIRTLAVSSCCLVLSQAAFAFDMSSADAAFAKRENNPAAIAEARAGYRAALKAGSAQEKRYAAERLGRLAYFEGDLMTPENDEGKRKQIFGECLSDVEAINPSQVGSSIEYHYWKAVCTAFWCKAAGKFASLGKVGALKDALRNAEEMDKARTTSYEGGGIHRVLAGIYIGSRAMSLFGLYDPEAALVHINKALALGPSHYNAYVIKADVLETLGQRSAAFALLEDARRDLKQAIKDSKLPAGYEPEARLMLPVINARLSK
jgi:tetratricopeptide (TPR) repeat protein